MVHEGPTEPITGLGFREPTEDSPNIYLYIVTTNRILAYQASGKSSGGTPVEIDEIGCDIGCATLDWRARDMVIAKDEAIYMFSIEGGGTCSAYEGQNCNACAIGSVSWHHSIGFKSFVHTHLNYLVIISPPLTASASAPSATVRNFAAKNTEPTDVTKVILFDLENKLVAYSGTHTEGIRHVFSVGRHVYLLSNDGQVSSLCL